MKNLSIVSFLSLILSLSLTAPVRADEHTPMGTEGAADMSAPSENGTTDGTTTAEPAPTPKKKKGGKKKGKGAKSGHKRKKK
ncbi:MAG: hypothetical protein EOP48_34100, partial [Sphingobacteriales bacterium]